MQGYEGVSSEQSRNLGVLPKSDTRGDERSYLFRDSCRPSRDSIILTALITQGSAMGQAPRFTLGFALF